ncbi:hypothetical protein AURDEDRAFT_150067 [Auricularia subglabra TFB-10046 SS5]|nr:hypothetical protein AURDEDRAFT_150067 [Auricularia subglabra TFB-10046 SS5]
MKDATPPELPQPLPPRWTPTADAQDIHVPGLDTNAPVSEQIEQIEQLITIKLQARDYQLSGAVYGLLSFYEQNLDENFAAIHHIITTRLLPAIKRYSVASEPIREAARFWISFFQASAQVRMRMDGDLSTPNQSNDRTVTASHTDSESRTRGTEETGEEGDAGESFRTAQNDLSFQPPPTSSTPLLSRSQLGAGPANPTPESSWAASMESPFSRLDKQISNLHLGDTPAAAAAPAKPPAPPSQAKSRMSLPRLKPRTPGPYKPRLPPAVEFKDTSESSGPSFSPPLHVTPMILRPPPAAADTTASTTTTNSSVFFDRPVFHPRSTEKNKGKGKATPLRENIFRRNLLLSAAAPPQSSPRRAAPSPKKQNPWSAQKQWNGIVDLREQQPPVYDTSDDEEDDALPAGMSPPVTMRFTRPSDVRLSRAPAPVAAQRVSQGLIAETSRRSLGRGARPSMGVSGMLRPPPGQGTPGRRRAKKDSIEGSMVDAAPTSESSAGPSFSDVPHTPGLQGYANYGALFGGGDGDGGGDADGSDSEDSFWMDSETAGVQMQASNADFSDDDSAEFDFVGGVPVTPPMFQPMDSSFDHDDDDGGSGEATDTIFGARHVVARPSEGPLHIHGTELLRETLDPATSEEAMPSVEQSPTPWAGRRPDYSFDVPH